MFSRLKVGRKCPAGCEMVHKSNTECTSSQYSGRSPVQYLSVVTDTLTQSERRPDLTSWSDWRPSQPLIRFSIFKLLHVCKRINMVRLHSGSPARHCDACPSCRCAGNYFSGSSCPSRRSERERQLRGAEAVLHVKCVFCANLPFSPGMPLWHLTLFAIEGILLELIFCSKVFLIHVISVALVVYYI